MLLKVFVCLLFVSLVSTRSVTQDNNRYIIVLREGATLGDIELVKDKIKSQEESGEDGLEMLHVNNLIPMVFATMGEDTVDKILALPEVRRVERDQLVYMLPLVATPNTSKWLDHSYPTDRYGLDIMSKSKGGCRDDLYTPPNDGTGADIYILDTGINYDHMDFSGRAAFGGYDAIGDCKQKQDIRQGWDCNGHGTHVAGTAGGEQSGVAKGAKLWSIKVLGTTGSGTLVGILNGLDYVAGKHAERKGKSDFVGSIVSMSLGSGYSEIFNDQVNALVSKGVPVVTASGNDGMDACDLSPGSAKDSINVGAHMEPVTDAKGEKCSCEMAYFSSWGKCVDIIAPGVDILSAYYGNDYGFVEYSGTSMAAPHVSGAVALIMAHDKSLSPKKVKSKIKKLQAKDINRDKEPKTVRRDSKSGRLHVPPTFKLAAITH